MIASRYSRLTRRCGPLCQRRASFEGRFGRPTTLTANPSRIAYLHITKMHAVALTNAALPAAPWYFSFSVGHFSPGGQKMTNKATESVAWLSPIHLLFVLFVEQNE